jgi:hypothetical protein
MDAPKPATEEQAEESLPPLRSVHTSNFPHLLEQLGISLVITTYQAGKVVFLRADQGRLNTHFRDMQAPMGLALHDNRLAVGGPWTTLGPSQKTPDPRPLYPLAVSAKMPIPSLQKGRLI